MGIQTRFCTIVPAITWSRKNTRKNAYIIMCTSYDCIDNKQNMCGRVNFS